MARASGVSAAVYGNAAAPAAQKEIHNLRSGVKGCCLKGILYSNNDAFLHGLGLHWTADPGAHAILAPWQVMQSALRNGVLSRGGMEWLWEASHQSHTGPFACAITALARAG
eukprot:2151030-Heterocapsa_arctica.AAC.1